MRLYIFHVPVQKVLVCAILAQDEADARSQLEAGVCEQLYTKPGTTASGEVELVAVEETGETNEEP